MRPKINTQSEFDLHPSNLQITNDYFATDQAISDILDDNRSIVDAVHHDLEPALKEVTVQDKRGAQCKFISDTILRIARCQILEGCALRQIIIRLDDSNFLRRFVRIFNGPMIDFTAFCTLKNRIPPETWKNVNDWLAQAAVAGERIEGERLRLDTTAVETNIHYPTDSSLLGDTYRTLARTLERIREIDPARVGDRRRRLKKVKKLPQKIARKASKNARSREALKPRYGKLFGLVENSLQWAGEIVEPLTRKIDQPRYLPLEQAAMEFCLKELVHYRALGERVLDQARRRILEQETVPNKEKIFSLFEPLTELLKRGQAARPIEFGPMIQIHQVEGKFSTDYEVFETKPVEHELVEPALERHQELFGTYPDELAADKGYYAGRPQIERLSERVETVAISKKGKRTEEQTQREADPAFRHAQRFRAGVEGTISFLKRVLGLFRCYNKGWEHYVATVGATIFAHNLLILARG